MRQQRAEDCLRNVVSTGGKLVEDEMVLRYLRPIAVRFLFQVIQGAGDQDMVRDPSPIEFRLRTRASRSGLRDGGGGHGRPKCRPRSPKTQRSRNLEAAMTYDFIIVATDQGVSTVT